MTSPQEDPGSGGARAPVLPLVPWLAGVGVLALHGIVLAPPAFGAGRLLVAVLALLAASAPLLGRWVSQDGILETGLVPTLGLVGVLPLSLRAYQSRLVVGTGLALVVGGYFLLRFADRLERAHETGHIGGRRKMSEAWRFAWTRIGIVTGAALGLALVLTQVPRWAGALLGERWALSVDAVSVHAVGLLVLVFLAAGTGITLLRLARAVDEHAQDGSDGDEHGQAEDGPGAPQPSQAKST